MSTQGKLAREHESTQSTFVRASKKRSQVFLDPCSEDQFSNLHADRIKASIKKYRNYPSKICIKDKISSNNPKFSFNFVSFEQTLDDINKLNPEKAFQATDIPVPFIKGNDEKMS